MVKEIIFRTRDTKWEEKELSKYTKIFINVKKNGNVKKLSLSKNSGDFLYIISSENYDDLYEYMRVEKNEFKDKEIVKSKPEIKRAKQGNLFGFLKKK